MLDFKNKSHMCIFLFKFLYTDTAHILADHRHQVWETCVYQLYCLATITSQTFLLCCNSMMGHSLLRIIISTADKLFQQGSESNLIWIAWIHFDSCFYNELLDKVNMNCLQASMGTEKCKQDQRHAQNCCFSFSNCVTCHTWSNNWAHQCQAQINFGFSETHILESHSSYCLTDSGNMLWECSFAPSVGKVGAFFFLCVLKRYSEYKFTTCAYCQKTRVASELNSAIYLW